MFEQIVKKCFHQAPQKNINKKIFYVLTHKKHKREIYFEKDNVESLKFMEQKFNSFKKKIIFFLIKINILQIFLKKIYLNSNVGGLVFVGGQIKIFNFNRKKILSFPLKNEQFAEFLKSKKFQKNFASEISPKINLISQNPVFSEEELLKKPKKIIQIKIFEKLIKFYSKMKIKEVSLKQYVENLNKKLHKKQIKNKFLFEVLQNLKKTNQKILLVNIHGDFDIEQILLKDNSYIFTDWEPKISTITDDLINFFKRESIYFKNKSLYKLLNLYPEKVRKNIKMYFILNEIETIYENPKYLLKGIKNIKQIKSL